MLVPGQTHVRGASAGALARRKAPDLEPPAPGRGGHVAYARQVGGRRLAFGLKPKDRIALDDESNGFFFFLEGLISEVRTRTY